MTYKLGILGTANIAYNRFIPALKKCNKFEYVGVASRDIRKADKFIQTYGGKGYSSYDDMINDETVECVYIPLPPAFHFEWAQKALRKGKHVLLEKPFTTSLIDTKFLLRLSEKMNLAVYENYMFQYHSQLKYILNEIGNHVIGEMRQIRIAFCFPKRPDNDFRYNKELGGGAILDCGGYTIKLASIILGKNAQIKTSSLVQKEGMKIDLFGSATMENDAGITAQLTFGMDNNYKCELEIIGSKGTLKTERIFTAPPDFKPIITIVDNNNNKVQKNLYTDNQFLNSIEMFYKCIKNIETRKIIQSEIITQSTFVENIIKGGVVK